MRVFRFPFLFLLIASGHGLCAQPLDWQFAFNGPATHPLVGLHAGSDRVYGYGYLGTLISTSDGVSWDWHRLPTDHDVTQVVSGNGVVLVSTRGNLSYCSEDLMVWEVVEHQPDSQIVFGNGVFVRFAVKEYGSADTGSLQHSVDGRTWTSTLFSGNVETPVVFGNGRFLLRTQVGVWTSQDGKYWEQANALNLSSTRLSVGNGLFVAIDRPSSSDAQIHISSDGVVWASRPLPMDVAWPDHLDLFHFDGVFYAVEFISAEQGLSSVDGVEWVPTPLPESIRLQKAVQIGARRLTLGYYSNSDMIFWHEGDGEWQPSRTRITRPVLQNIAYGNGVYVASGYRSEDGVRWTKGGFTPSGEVGSLRVEFCHDRFFYFEESASGSPSLSRVLVSLDGISTSLVRVSTEGLGGGDIVFGNGRFVLTGPTGIWTSLDGYSWIPRSSLAFHSVAFGAGLFVGIGDRSIWSSLDGVSWTERFDVKVFQPSRFGDASPPYVPSLHRIEWGNDRFVVTGSRNHEILEGFRGWTVLSGDGINWISTERYHVSGSWPATRPLGFNPESLGFANGLFVATASELNNELSGYYATIVPGVYTSTDGVDWTRQSSPVDHLSTIVVGGDERIYATGRGGILAASMPEPDPADIPGRVELPAFNQQPITSVTLDRNRRVVTLAADVTSSGPTRYQWRRNGEPMVGVNRATFTIDGAWATEKHVVYDVVVSNLSGSVVSDPSYLEINYSRLVNLSSRAFVGSGEDAVIQGMVLTGAGAGDSPFSLGKQLLFRSVGPTLSNFGVEAVLEDPELSLVRQSDQSVVFTNDNWFSFESPYHGFAEDVFARAGAFALPKGSADAVIINFVENGAYTLQVSGADGGSGIALTEIYDYYKSGRLVNLSTRARVGEGERTLVTGFVIEGTIPLRVLIRGVGPSLADVGIEDPLPNPRLVLFDATGSEMSNNDTWHEGTFADEIKTVAESVGAFALADDSNDAALLVWLEPGAYTAQIEGVGEPDGIALVELYEVTE